MGMSASQARLMSLTSRLSDLELRAQNIQNSKIRLADMSEQASKNYAQALDKETLTVYSGLRSDGTSSYMDATAANLTTYGAVSNTDKQRFIKDASNRLLVTNSVANAYNSAGGNLSTFLASVNPSADAGANSYYTNVFKEIQESGGCNPIGDSNMNSPEWLTGQIHAGNIFLYEYDKEGGPDGKGDFVNVSWTSGDASLNMESEKKDLAKAEAEYETTLASIQTKDKRFDLELTQINTEHKAIETEMDSVKKVIDKNIERSFKIFDA